MRMAIRVFKRVVPLTLAAVFLPRLTAFYVACGLIDRGGLACHEGVAAESQPCFVGLGRAADGDEPE